MIRFMTDLVSITISRGRRRREAISREDQETATNVQESANMMNIVEEEIPRDIRTMDANRYATKKTIAQGMLDIALLTANASQLKYILQIGERHEFYKLMLTLIVMSIVLQVVSGILSLSLNWMRDCRLHLEEFETSANIINNIRTGMAIFTTMIIVGVLFVVIGSLNLNRTKDQFAAIIINDAILAMVFVISVTNVIASGFGMEYSATHDTLNRNGSTQA